MYPCIEEICVKSGGGRWHCQWLASQVLLKRSKEMDITGHEIKNVKSVAIMQVRLAAWDAVISNPTHPLSRTRLATDLQDANMKYNITSSIQTLETAYVYTGICGWGPLCGKCLNVGGDYVESDVYNLLHTHTHTHTHTLKSQLSTQHQCACYHILFKLPSTYVYTKMQGYSKWLSGF